MSEHLFGEFTSTCLTRKLRISYEKNMFCLRGCKSVFIFVTERQMLNINFCVHKFIYLIYHYFSYGSTALLGLKLLFIEVFAITLRNLITCRKPPDKLSGPRKAIYLTTHNTHNKHQRPRKDSNPRFQQASGRRPAP